MICVDTALPYHQQDLQELCGRAVAQMILALPKLGGNVFSQEELLRRPDPVISAMAKMMAGNAGKAPWNTSPDDLCAILNMRASVKGFAVNPDRTREDGCQRIAHAIVSTGIAVPAVVFGAQHWVAVTAVMLEGDPNGAPSGPPYPIKGFFINNPMPSVPAARVHAPDDLCGRNGEANGSANTYVTLQSWKEQFWQEACTDLDDGPAFVTVSSGPPLPPAALNMQPGAAAAVLSTPLSPQDALKVAHDGIRDHDLQIRGPLKSVLASAQARSANGQNDDDNDNDPTFFVVHLVNDADKTVALAIVNAIDREFHGVQGPPSHKVPFNEPPSIVERILAGSLKDLQTFADSLEFTTASSNAENVTIAPNLIWQPSVQSVSPYYAFIHADIAGERWLIGVDGSVHRDFQHFERIHA